MTLEVAVAAAAAVVVVVVVVATLIDKAKSAAVTAGIQKIIAQRTTCGVRKERK